MQFTSPALRLSWSGRDDAVAYEWVIVSKPPNGRAQAVSCCSNCGVLLIIHWVHPHDTNDTAHVRLGRLLPPQRPCAAVGFP